MLLRAISVPPPDRRRQRTRQGPLPRLLSKPPGMLDQGRAPHDGAFTCCLPVGWFFDDVLSLCLAVLRRSRRSRCKIGRMLPLCELCARALWQLRSWLGCSPSSRCMCTYLGSLFSGVIRVCLVSRLLNPRSLTGVHGPCAHAYCLLVCYCCALPGRRLLVVRPA